MTASESTSSAWSSGLSTNDFAACLDSGLQPLGFVQGCSVVSWNFYSMRSSMVGVGFGSNQLRGYSEQYNCPHGFVSSEHRGYGLNYQMTWIEEAWTEAFGAAKRRLLEEATSLGAHGVIDVVDRSIHHVENSTFEIALSGTAVGIADVARPDRPFATFLAGQKLNKLVEAGFAPVDIALGITAVGVIGSCITEYQMRGGLSIGANIGNWGAPQKGEIEQLVRAQSAARQLVRERVRSELGGDTLHGASLRVRTIDTGEGPQIEAQIRGNRVRSFKAFAKLAPPRPVIQLADR
ncbi:MAG TPA: hypothetical protein VMU99_07300 [Acidimicrobiales bacterium]|nr:hypothetical protein [Acidimicrobiales bacterium]